MAQEIALSGLVGEVDGVPVVKGSYFLLPGEHQLCRYKCACHAGAGEADRV